MRSLEEFFKELGVEKGKKFLATDGLYYKIDSGQLFVRDGGWLFASIEKHMQLLSGEIKSIWKPERGDFYWTIEFDERDKIYQYIWDNGEAEQRLFREGLIFKTKRDVITAANKMLEALKEED